MKILGPLRARAGAHGAGVAGLAGGRALRRPRRLRRRPAAPPPRAPLGEVRLPSLELPFSHSLINLDYAKMKWQILTDFSMNFFQMVEHLRNHYQFDH